MTVLSLTMALLHCDGGALGGVAPFIDPKGAADGVKTDTLERTCGRGVGVRPLIGRAP